MPIIKSTVEILSDPWRAPDEDYPHLPTPEKTSIQKIPTIEDIEFWEQLYYQPGNVGIYVAWTPFTEFYMITYNMFLKTTNGTQTFFGPNAYMQVCNRASELGITLPVNKIWVDDQYYHNPDDISS